MIGAQGRATKTRTAITARPPPGPHRFAVMTAKSSSASQKFITRSAA
jgi:hypothetical protein